MTLPSPPVPSAQDLGGTSFIEKGEGEALLLIHGVGLNAEAWAPQIAAFSATHRVIALDMLGHGRASAARRRGLDDYVSQARRLLDDLGITVRQCRGPFHGRRSWPWALPSPIRSACGGWRAERVHERDEARAAVEARAAAIAPGMASSRRSTAGSRTSIALRDRCAHGSPSPSESYAPPTASSPRATCLLGQAPAFSARPLRHGEGDPNSTPAMAEAMAAASRGRAPSSRRAPHDDAHPLAGDQRAALGTPGRAAQQLRQPRTSHRLRQLHDRRHHRDHGGRRRPARAASPPTASPPSRWSRRCC